MSRLSDWRDEIFKLSSEELDDELQRPVDTWNEMVLREAMRRILYSQNGEGENNG